MDLAELLKDFFRGEPCESQQGPREIRSVEFAQAVKPHEQCSGAPVGRKSRITDWKESAIELRFHPRFRIFQNLGRELALSEENIPSVPVACEL